MSLTLTILLFLCGLAGFILNRNNVILLIVAIELLLLAVLEALKLNSFFTILINITALR
jgi:NADH-ubiquinone oxidoreductase chain 4L